MFLQICSKLSLHAAAICKQVATRLLTNATKPESVTCETNLVALTPQGDGVLLFYLLLGVGFLFDVEEKEWVS